MGVVVGDKTHHMMNFHIHKPHHILQFHHHSQNSSQTRKELKDVPKGCLAILVGQSDEEQQRFVIPLIYFTHPLFMELLKEAEEEFGFRQKGTLTIPCRVDDFLHVRGIIDEEHDQHHHVLCFRV